jgi:hypothetical protein
LNSDKNVYDECEFADAMRNVDGFSENQLINVEFDEKEIYEVVKSLKNIKHLV